VVPGLSWRSVTSVRETSVVDECCRAVIMAPGAVRAHRVRVSRENAGRADVMDTMGLEPGAVNGRLRLTLLCCENVFVVVIRQPCLPHTDDERGR
jgi:hypothetical protein